MATMPMFPLTHPLLPGAGLPLHVFEPRYRAMFQDILADDDHPPEFGVTMIARGHEVGGGEERTEIGCVARIIDMNVTPDGRYGVMTVGTEPIRVVEWLPDDPYPRAEVEHLPADDGPPLEPGALEALRRRVDAVNALARELGATTPPDDIEISDEPDLALFHLAALAPIGPADRYRVLAAAGRVERAEVLTTALDDVAAVLEFRRS